MILRVVSNKRDVLPLHFLPQMLCVNSAAYTNVLDTFVKTLITAVERSKPCVFQQESPPSHMSHTTKEWLANNFHDDVTPNIWTTTTSDINPLAYYVWALLKWSALCIYITQLQPSDNLLLWYSKTHLITTFQWSRRHLQEIVAKEGSFVQWKHALVAFTCTGL